MSAMHPVTMPAGITRHLPVLALAIAPAMGVLVLRAMLPSQGPASAKAAPAAVTDEALILPADAQWTPAQQELRTIMTQEAAKGFASSPVLTRRREVVENTTPTPDLPNPDSEPPDVTPPSAALTSVMAAGEHAIAVIDGKVRRIGDAVAPGWKVSAIDRAAGTATLVHVGGTTHVLALRGR